MTYTKKQIELLTSEEVQRKFIVYDGGKYKNVREAILRKDYQSKQIATYESLEHPCLMEMSDYFDNTIEMIKFLNPNAEMVYYYYGIDLISLYHNNPTDLDEICYDFDSGESPFEFVKYMIVYFSKFGGLKIKNKRKDLSNENSYEGFSIDLYKEILIANLKNEVEINGIDLDLFFYNLNRDEKIFKEQMKITKKLINY